MLHSYMTALIIFCANYLILVVALLAAYFLLTAPHRYRRELAITMALALVLTYTLGQIAGAAYYDARPFVANHLTPLIPHVPDNGFPSDHALLAFGLAAAFLPFSKKQGLILLGLGGVIAAARVMANVHHVIDMVGALFCALLATTLARWWRDRTRVAK